MLVTFQDAVPGFDKGIREDLQDKGKIQIKYLFHIFYFKTRKQPH